MLSKFEIRHFVNEEMDIDAICRSCLTYKTEMKSIFDSDTNFGNGAHYSEVIKNISFVEVNIGDGMPDKICDGCINEMKRAFTFITQLQSSDQTLRMYQVNKIDVDLQQLDNEDEDYKDIEIEYLESDGDVKPVISDSSSDLDNEPLASRLAKQTQLSKEDVQKVDLRKYVKELGKPRSKQKVTYTCQICGTSFNNKKCLTQHNQVHEPNKHKCEECGKTFSEKMYLKVHMRSHFTSEKRPYVCNEKECNKRYAYEYQLTQHMYRHTDVKPFPCPQCDRGCITADSLRRHMKVHEDNYSKRKHTCHICNKEFPYPSFLAEHMKNHTGERPFLCSYCGKGFRQKGALQYHIRMHTGNKPFQCQTCKMSFISQGILKVHMRRHTNERPYICDICGRGFRQSTDMKSHRRTHTGDKPVQCSVCNKRMSTTGQLTIHMRIHTGEKPFSCPECTKAFSTKTMVVKHLRTHTGEKPYICTVCGKAFSQSSSLKTHFKIHERHHSNAKTKQEECQLMLLA